MASASRKLYLSGSRSDLRVPVREITLSEAHFNLLSFAPGLESNDTLDGDELRVRLLGLNDDKPPTLPDVVSAPTLAPVHASAPRCASRALGRPTPRGPPSRSAA